MTSTGRSSPGPTPKPRVGEFNYVSICLLAFTVFMGQQTDAWLSVPELSQLQHLLLQRMCITWQQVALAILDTAYSRMKHDLS